LVNVIRLAWPEWIIELFGYWNQKAAYSFHNIYHKFFAIIK
jgi:hypothetical protein